MKSPEEQKYEERVQRRVRILFEQIEKGNLRFEENLVGNIQKSLDKIKFDEKGDPIIETIDGRVRSTALFAENLDHKQKMKNAISLYQIQERYFQRIDANFNHFYKMMIDNNVSAGEVANNIAYSNQNLDFLDNAIELVIKDLEEYWDLVAESAYLHLEEKDDSIKAVFGGDLFPKHDENIASKCGIYTDTIILPCPFIRSRGMFKVWNKKERVFFLLKHALNILQYKDLALAELETPILVIIPDKEMLEEFAFEKIRELGEKDAIYHARKVFDRKFKSFEELIEFGRELNTVDKVLSEVKDKKRVLFDLDFKEPLNVQLENQVKGESARGMRTDNPGLIVSLLGLGRMSVCNELLIKSTKVGGVPLIEAPTSWEYFKWKLEYDAERTFPEKDYSKMHIVKGLNGLDRGKLQWIGKIPPKALIELRKDGAINEIRAILSKGMDELILANDFDFTNTSHKVFNNLNMAFNRHQENIDKLKTKKWNIAGKDFGSWLVMGSVEIASACIGTPLYGLSTVVLNQVLDAPKLKDLPKTIEEIKGIEREKEKMMKSPIGLMFNYKK